MDWLEKHKVVINCLDKTFTCVNDEGKECKLHGITRLILVRLISAMQLNKWTRKGCKLLVVQLIETNLISQKPSIEDYEFLGECVSQRNFKFTTEMRHRLYRRFDTKTHSCIKITL